MFDTVKLALATLRTMREGVRFGDELPDEAGPPAAARVERTSALEEYFDAVEEGPGIWKWRHYFPIYHRHLSKFVGREVHLVEIGIYSGGSLPMWRSYFGSGCQVYGVDIEPACAAHEAEGVRVFIGDQADPTFWEQFLSDVPRVDVVIDDGGHKVSQQIASIRSLLPRMAMGGVYICEDVNAAPQQFHSFVDGMTRPLNNLFEPSSPALGIHQHIASVHRYPALIVVEKPDQQVEAFESIKHGTVWEPGIYT